MNLIGKLAMHCGERLIQRALARPADFVIGGRKHPYLLRWYLLGGRWKVDDDAGRRRWVSRSFLGFRPYLHCFLRSDDDRALHDHPAASLSFGVRNEATEHTIARGGVHHRETLRPGDIRFRSAKFAHRIEIPPGGDYWTIFIFMDVLGVRGWGFHCQRRWVPWREFTAADDPGSIGAGCGEP